MTPEEQKAKLDEIGQAIRLNELPDDEVVMHVVIDMLHGVAQNDLQLTLAELGEMVSHALVKLGGFHRVGTCTW